MGSDSIDLLSLKINSRRTQVICYITEKIRERERMLEAGLYPHDLHLGE